MLKAQRQVIVGIEDGATKELNPGDPIPECIGPEDRERMLVMGWAIETKDEKKSPKKEEPKPADKLSGGTK